MNRDAVRDAAWLHAAPLRAVLTALNGAGEETRIVGGAVRDALMGFAVGDVDLATTALPEEVIRRASEAGLKAVPTGLAHGTVTVVSAGIGFEVTSLREDVETDGRHAVVRFGRDWALDARRRDFTINALFATADGAIIDLVDGLPDVAARRVRFIGDAGARIREDHLRILRLFRFHARFGGGEIDPAALTAAIRNRAGVAALSRERVRAELLKLLVAAHAAPTLRTMSETGFLAPILAGVPDLAGLDRLVALEHALGLEPDPMRRLGVLAVRVREDAERLGERLRLSKAQHRRLLGLAEQTVSTGLAAHEARASLYRRGRAAFEDALLLTAARARATAPEVTRLLGLAQSWEVPRRPFRAADFLARGLKPGPALGLAVSRAEAAWIDADFPEDPAAFAAMADAACAQVSGDAPLGRRGSAEDGAGSDASEPGEGATPSP